MRRRTISWREVRTARGQARRFRRAQPGSLCVCWDLDNTLVDSGSLLRAGRRLDQAIVEADPVANMLEFYDAMHKALPGAAHFVLSARAGSMRAATFDWFARYGVTASQAQVCLVPYANAKPGIWRELAEYAQLVIIDDLSFNHESETPDLYRRLIAQAQRLARVYIGFDQIAQIAADRQAIDAVIAKTREALAAPGPESDPVGSSGGPAT